MERDDALHPGGDAVTASVLRGNFGGRRVDRQILVSSSSAPHAAALENLCVTDETRRRLLRSRIFGSIAVAGAEGVTLHRGILRIVSDHLLGRNPMAATDGERIFVEFALESAARDNAVVVRRFAEGVAGLMGADAVVEKAQVMQFDTSDIDHLLLPEHRSE